MAMDFNKIKMAVESANKINEPLALPEVEGVVSDSNKDASPQKNASDIDMIGAGVLMLRDFIADMNIKIEYIMKKNGITNEEIAENYANKDNMEESEVTEAQEESEVQEEPVEDAKTTEEV